MNSLARKIALSLKIFYIAEMQRFFLCFLLLFSPCFSLGAENRTLQNLSQVKAGEKALEKLLKKYDKTSFQIKVKQEVFLSLIKTNLISEGVLNVKGQKFRLSLKGKPSSLTVFDGSFLWYQADTKEKVVFKLKDPMPFQILTAFFNKTSFLKAFQIKEFQKKGPFNFYHLQPQQEMKGLEGVFIKSADFILEIRLVWKDLKNWQRYKLSKPYKTDFSEEMFQFSVVDFQVIDPS